MSNMLKGYEENPEESWYNVGVEKSVKSPESPNTLSSVRSKENTSTMKIYMPIGVNSYGMTETELQDVKVCKLSGTIVDLRYDFDRSLVILDQGRIVTGYVQGEMAIGGYSPLKDYLAKKSKVGDTFSAIITESNTLVINEKNISKYPHVNECNLEAVQTQSLKIFPDLAKWNIQAVDAKVLERTPKTPKEKTVDHCQINEMVLATKSSFLKNQKGITTAFIFQNDGGDIFTARDQTNFTLKQSTNLLTSFEASYKEFHGKKLHVVIDRGNKNTILSQYTSADKSLPLCMETSVEENSIFPIFSSTEGLGTLFALLSISFLVLLAVFAKKIHETSFGKM